MKIKSKSIGSFDAKTHLSRVLDDVQRGYEYVITKRGRPVARLTRFTENTRVPEMKDLLRQFDEIYQSVKGTVRIKAFIKEGRKR
jgi:prevent-host-death family protein